MTSQLQGEQEVTPISHDLISLSRQQKSCAAATQTIEEKRDRRDEAERGRANPNAAEAKHGDLGLAANLSIFFLGPPPPVAQNARGDARKAPVQSPAQAILPTDEETTAETECQSRRELTILTPPLFLFSIIFYV